MQYAFDHIYIYVCMCVCAVRVKSKQMKKCSESRYITDGELQLNIGEKRKLYRLHENEYLGNVELPPNAVSPAAFETSDWTQCDESDGDGNTISITRDLEKVDRESKGFGSIDGFRSKVATLASMDSSSAPRKKSVSRSSRRRKIPATASKMPPPPPPAELEEFLAEAEKYVQERFAEKYNYDIAKDVPLDGRYQWVLLHP